jgi:hypothetical protein
MLIEQELNRIFLWQPYREDWPVEVAENLKYENHNEGNQYLHGIFQQID